LQEDSERLARESERAGYYTQIAHDLQTLGVLPPERIYLRPERVKVAVRAYFILNEAYHKWRIEDGHNTLAPKIAALQCMCFVEIEPFGLLEPNNAQTIGEARANAIYALACACSILGVKANDVQGQNKDQWLRILDVLRMCRCDTIQMFIEDINMSIQKTFDEYDLKIVESDKFNINTLITIFELLSQRGDAAS
jgi:hypothetical protein